jgi:peptidoglycan-associated lipoprotein
MRRWLLVACTLLTLLAAGCARRRAPTPPPSPPAPKQNIVVLLPEPDGTAGRISVTNSAGSQEMSQPLSAVQVERPDVAPTAPFPLDADAVRRMFGAAIDALPTAEERFLLYFVEGTDDLTAESAARVPEVFDAIRARHSTAVSVTGHTDTTGDPQSNQQLGMRRANRVAGILRARGIDLSSLFVASHGEADLLVKTPRGVAEQRNRRVEVIVR